VATFVVLNQPHLRGPPGGGKGWRAIANRTAAEFSRSKLNRRGRGQTSRLTRASGAASDTVHRRNQSDRVTSPRNRMQRSHDHLRLSVGARLASWWAVIRRESVPIRPAGFAISDQPSRDTVGKCVMRLHS
jgi:hypothetical protein